MVLGAARSASTPGDGRYRNSALWITPEAGIVATFDKTRAIPLAESARRVPGHALLERLIGAGDDPHRVEEASRQVPLRAGLSFVPALCFEILFPGLVDERRSADALAILNLANDSWFESPAASRQQLAFGAFRAIEQRLPVVRVAHGGVSAILDPYGRVTDHLGFGREGALWTTLIPTPAPGSGEKTAILALALGSGFLGGALTHLVWRRRNA